MSLLFPELERGLSCTHAAWLAIALFNMGRWLKQGSHQPYRIPSIKWYATVWSSVIL